MPTPPNRYESTLRDLEQAVAAVRRFSNEPMDKTLLAKACADAERCLGVFGDLLEDRSTSSLESFFGAVGAGVISAQRELDRHSIAYIQDSITEHAKALAPPAAAEDAKLGKVLKNGAEHGGAENWNALAIPPNAAMFRIPRVTAEFKFAVEQTTSKGINVIFYSNKVESQSLQQQTATIEVVSVPLPPNYRPPAPDAAPAGRLANGDRVSLQEPDKNRPSDDPQPDKLRPVEASKAPSGGAPAKGKPVPSQQPVIFSADSDEDSPRQPAAAGLAAQRNERMENPGDFQAVRGLGELPPVANIQDARHPALQVRQEQRAGDPLGPAIVPELGALSNPFAEALAGRVLDEGSRRDLFARIVPTIEAMGMAGFAHRRLLTKSGQARTVILEGEGHRYFLLYGRTEPLPQLVIWEFSASPPQLQQLVRLRADPQHSSGLMHACRLLEQLGSEQVALRDRHGG